LISLVVQRFFRAFLGRRSPDAHFTRKMKFGATHLLR
jgi:hypothetical protein